MSFNCNLGEEMINCYSQKTKETIENVRELELRLAALSSSGSDNDDVHVMEKCVKLKKRQCKKRNNKRKKTLVENSIIIEDEIEEYIPMGGEYRLNNNTSGGDTYPKRISDSPITVIDDEVQIRHAIDKNLIIVLDDEVQSNDSVVIDEPKVQSNNSVVIDEPKVQSNNSVVIDEPKVQSNNSVVIDEPTPCYPDLEIVSVNLPSIITNTVNEVQEETTCRRSKRLKTARTMFNNSRPTTRSDRRGRNRRASNSVDDITVVTFDEEYPIPQCSYTVPKRNDLASTQDSDNKVMNYNTTSETVTVFVSWRLQSSEKFEIPRYRPLKSIFDYYAEKENIPVTCVVLTKDLEILTPKDTPDSAEFKCVQLLKGYKANVEQKFVVSAAKPVVLEEDDIELKVLLQNKRPLMLTLKKYHSMNVIVSKCAAQLECADEDVVLFFDGEKINLNDTPVDLDLQSGECVDAHVKISNLNKNQ